MTGGEPKSRLEEISTRWSLVGDPMQFVMRYAPAIRKYLWTITRSNDDAEEVLQTFLLNVLGHRFARTNTDQGRFRFYLKQAVRNAARTHHRQSQRRQFETIEWDQLADNEEAPLAEADEVWLAQWRHCLLDRAWTAIESYQRCHQDNWSHTVLRLRLEHSADGSASLALRLSAVVGRTIQSATFDKQLSRARRRFAHLLLKEVAETIENPTAERIEDELIDLGLHEYLRDLLPPDWRTQLHDSLSAP